MMILFLKLVSVAFKFFILTLHEDFGHKLGHELGHGILSIV